MYLGTPGSTATVSSEQVKVFYIGRKIIKNSKNAAILLFTFTHNTQTCLNGVKNNTVRCVLAHSRATSVRRGNSPNVFVNGTHKTDFMSLWIQPCFMLPVVTPVTFKTAGWIGACTLLFTLACLRSSSAEMHRLLRRPLQQAHRSALRRQLCSPISSPLSCTAATDPWCRWRRACWRWRRPGRLLSSHCRASPAGGRRGNNHYKSATKKSILFTELSHNTQLLIESHETLNKASKDLEFWIIPTSGSESQLFKEIRLLSKWKAEQL